MTPNEAFEMLKYNPNKASRECVFAVNIPKFRPRSVVAPSPCGFKANVRLGRLEGAQEENMFELFIDGPGNDCYFYPYTAPLADTPEMPGHPGLGFCFVPVDSPPGTLVLIGGMNGCALQVNRTADNTNFIFMHENDGSAINAGTKPRIVQLINDEYRRTHAYAASHVDALANAAAVDNRICRIIDDEYIDIDFRAVPQFFYYLITVKTPGPWVVYSYCIVEDHLHRKRRGARPNDTEHALKFF